MVSTSDDAEARREAREELGWSGPWLAAALPRTAALAEDASRPAVARLAAAVAASLADGTGGDGR